MNAKLLVVDDEKEIRDALVRHFQFLGYDVLTASNGAEALTILETRKVDMVVSDIVMPVMNGVDLLRKVRKDHPMVRVIMITGYVTQENVMACMRHHADTCIFKPWPDMKELENAVNEAAHDIDMWKQKLHRLIDMNPEKRVETKEQIQEANAFLADDMAILGEFVDESEADLAKISSLFLELEKKPGDAEIVNSIFRPIHSIKGNSTFLGLLKVRALSHEMETLLDDIRRNRIAASQDAISILLGGVDELRAMMARIRRQENELADTTAFESLVKSIASLQAARAKKEERGPARTEPEPPAAAPVASVAPKSATPAEAAHKPELARTVRIQEAVIDDLLAMAGEIGRVYREFSALPDKWPGDVRGAVASEFTPHLVQLGSLSERLESHLVNLRRLPLRELFQRAPRIARDLSQSTGKAVEIHLSGEDILAPKSLIEMMESPLTHMVRNALDHGIELPAERKKLGKSPTGHLWIEAKETPDALALRVADDGAGIDFKTLLKRALELGLCPTGRNLTPEDITNLIYLPGVSTAKKVTDVSGRGVGMDVVKHNVEAAGGKIKVNTKAGKGAEFIIVFPK